MAYLYPERDESEQAPRVVILIDGNSPEVLENKAGIRVEFIRSIKISDSLTAEPPDEDEAPRILGCDPGA